MKCKEIMTKDPACCVPGDTAARIAKLMKDRNVGSIPVCDDEQSKRLVGIITDRDLTLRVVAEAKDPNSAAAREIMTRDPFTCSPEDELQKALDIMENRKVRRVPVVDDGGRLAGIIAQADVATRTKEPQKLADVIEEISKPSTMRAR